MRTPRPIRAENTVNCYFCHRLFEDSQVIEADDFNGGDGGSVCVECRAEWMHDFESDTEPRQCINCGQWDREIDDWDFCEGAPGIKVGDEVNYTN